MLVCQAASIDHKLKGRIAFKMRIVFILLYRETSNDGNTPGYPRRRRRRRRPLLYLSICCPFKSCFRCAQEQKHIVPRHARPASALTFQYSRGILGPNHRYNDVDELCCNPRSIIRKQNLVDVRENLQDDDDV